MQGDNRGTRASPGDWRVPMNHANRTVTPGLRKAPKISAIFGLNVKGCYALYDHERQYLKTCQDFLIPMEDGSLTEFCLTFTNAGMMQNGRVSELRTSVRHILEKGYGSSVIQAIQRRSLYWRTPDANMERGKRSYGNMKTRIKEGKPLNLNDQLNAISKGLLPTPLANSWKTPSIHGDGSLNLQTAIQMFPTPKASDSEHGGPNQRDSRGYYALPGAVHHFPTPMKSDADKNSRFRKEHLPGAVMATTWGSPTANDAKNSLTRSQAGRGTLTAHIVESEDPQGGQLNPDWVEALMGYPLGWTDIEKENVPPNNTYPDAWLNGTWEDGIPRVAEGVKNRINRIMCLGNAIVPQCAELIFNLPAFDMWRVA